jgi:two-component system, sensor histidine kinase PdtaS
MEVPQRRLPERLQGRIPPVLTEVVVGVATAITAVGLRLPLHPILDERAPYVFIFVAIVVATLLAGWRSGLVACAGGQALTWFFVIEPHWSVLGTDDARTAGFLVGSISQLIVLAVVAAYQRAADRTAAEREQRMQLLGQSLREIDHRTKNNYQTVLAMIRLQSKEVEDQEGREALERTAERIQSVALVSQQLAYSSKDLKAVRLDNHLREMCILIARGLSRVGLQVECEAEQVTVQASKAIGISIIVNELITNSLQHAFPDRRDGAICVKSCLTDGMLELIVQDNGCGFSPTAPRVRTKPGGLGSKLIDSFVHQLNARHDVVSSARGTKHRILVPQIA